ncbi:MAG: hypothetical protein F6K19_15355 [Cyanothece sp. SIO1E1]|nr:hypothetical protein [Cyanothece sp. SIO1E1]
MNIPLILDIAIGLIFIYLILSLLASEIQELITTLLQWRAVHLKESIEGILGGDLKGTQFGRVRQLANELYDHPAISSLNQEAKGLIANLPRQFSRVFGDAYSYYYRTFLKRESVFGRDKSGQNKRSGPSYISSETFAASLLDTLGIPKFTKAITLFKLRFFLKEELLNKIVCILHGADDKVDDITFEFQNEQELRDYLKVRNIDLSNTDSRFLILRNFYKIKNRFYQIIQEFENEKIDLITSVDLTIESLERYIKTSKDLLTEDEIQELESLKEDFFGRDDGGANNNQKLLLLRGLQPSLTEVLEIVKECPEIYQSWRTEYKPALNDSLQSAIGAATEKANQETLNLLKQLEGALQNLPEVKPLTPESNEPIAPFEPSLASGVKGNGARETTDSVESAPAAATQVNAPAPATEKPLSRFEVLTQRIESLITGNSDYAFKSIKNEIKATFNAAADPAPSLPQHFLPELDRIHFAYRQDVQFAYENLYEEYKQIIEDEPRLSVEAKRILLALVATISLQKTAEAQALEAQMAKVFELAGADGLPAALGQNLALLTDRVQTKIQDTKEDVEELRAEVASWFDRSMERASGVYKRNAKLIAIMIGFVVAIATNADTVHIVQRLSVDQALRSVISQSSQDIAEQNINLEDALDAVDEAAENIPLPVGWGEFNRSKQRAEATKWATHMGNIGFASRYALGWLLSGIAVSMGASFWYGLLGKIVDVRNVGKKPSGSDSQGQ